MKIIRFAFGKTIKWGILSGKTVYGIKGTPFRGIQHTDEMYRLEDVKLLAPSVPSKIVCLGLNYKAHAEEANFTVPKTPLIFLKPPSSVIGPEDNIVYPLMTKRVDFEGELGIVIKKTARDISEDEALDYVLGYTCFNDVSARDIQSADVQWTRAKGFDTFGAFGPWIETELDPQNTPVQTYLNGVKKQDGNTNQMIFSVKTCLSFISQVMTLLPGDVIATGTPSGIGPMQPGDVVEIKIPPIGVLRNQVIKP
ncbi:MAG: fumarylacetoacetate hydrolase family protein [Dehalococcoidales bacterium]|nr:fumarylacetoacetate hydrolase family protein [Dehalococcoidales bacterium]